MTTPIYLPIRIIYKNYVVTEKITKQAYEHARRLHLEKQCAVCHFVFTTFAFTTST